MGSGIRAFKDGLKGEDEEGDEKETGDTEESNKD